MVRVPIRISSNTFWLPRPNLCYNHPSHECIHLGVVKVINDRKNLVENKTTTSKITNNEVMFYKAILV